MIVVISMCIIWFFCIHVCVYLLILGCVYDITPLVVSKITVL